MKYSNTVEYNISTKLDSSGLTKLQSQIKQLENSMQQMANRELLNSDKVQTAKTQLEGLNTALTNSFNSSLGILDLSKFRAELDAGGVSAKGLQSAFNMMGAEGQAALNGLTTQIANFNGGMERTSSAVDKVFTTFSNTFRWGMVSSFFSQFMNAIHSSIDYVKELDDSLTQIMLVTDYNKDSMNEFARSANEAAKAVSMTTTGMTNASLIFAQQGYNLGQSQELATLSAKLANASQQDTATTSDQITAYMNAYGLENSIGELTQAMDNWALIANISAADVGELAQASQRAASMANTVGVSGEQLAAQIATIESVTREAPEQIGNGLKTLYARFSDISAGGEDEDGVSLGDVTKQLNDIGVQVLDQFGNIRDVGDIMEDLMVVWDDLDQTSKIAAAQSLAGKYQVNRFVSLMDNSDMYREYLGATGSSAAGTLDQMNEEYAQSIEGRSAKLQASLEGLFSTIFNTDDIYSWIDAAQGAVDLLQQFFDALGGGKTVLLGITSLLGQAFSQNMARSINDTLANRQLMQTRQRNIEGVNDTLDRVGIDRNSGIGQYISNTAAQAKQGAINDAQYDTYMSNVQNWINAQTALTQSEEELQDTINALNMAYGKAVGENNAVFKDENGLNTQFANEERLNLSQDQVNKIMSQTDFSEAIAGAHNYSKALQDIQRLQQQYNSEAVNSKEQLQQLDLSIDQASIALKQLYNTGVISDDMFESMEAAVQKVRVELEQSGKATDQTEKELDELISVIARFSKTAEGMDANQLKKMLLGGADEVQRKQNARDFNQTQVNRAETDANESEANINSQQQVKEILDTLNAVQQLTFAWQAFQNLGSLWANEDLSTGEKILQTIMNLTMAMPQLITAMDTLKTSDTLKNVGESLLQSLDFSKNGQKGLFAKEQFDELVSAATKGREAMDAVKFAGRNMSDEIRQGLEKTIAEGALAEDALTKIGPELLETSMVGTTGLEAIKASLAGLATSAKAFLAEFWPLLLIGAAVAGISALIGAAQEQAEQAHQEAMSAFEDAKNAQQQVADLSAKIDEWKSKRSSQGNTQELAQEADVLADSLRELGNAEEAQKVHLAAIRAEANGTATSFNELENTLNAANQSMSDQSALATMEAANAVLKDRLSTTEEIAAANEAMQGAALDYNISQMSRTAGMDMGITSVGGDNDLRAATMDWQSLEGILDQSVPGFAEITDENEKLALALSHTSDEALRAAIQIEQLANANTNLTEGQQTSITQKLEGSGFSAQESFQLMASLDENASYQEIIQQIEEVRQQVDAGTPFEIALQAKMDPEQVREAVESSLAAYEPKDKDVDTADFQTLSGMFMDNADKMGEEGTPFADYSEDLLNDADALEEVVEGILRYDDAVQSLDENLEDWQDALADTNDFSQEHIDAVQNLQETYSDFLDLAEDMDVSEEFAANAENLELMEDAANGVEGAYEKLAQAAAEDILIHANVDDIDAAKTALSGLFDYLNSDAFSNLNIGDALDLSSIEQQINDLATATGWTADQMAAYLNQIGINIDPNMFEPINTALDNADANTAATANHIEGVVEGVADTVVDNLSYSTDTEMTAQTDTQQDQIMYTNLTPRPGPTTTIESTFPVGSANPTASGSGAIETQTAVATVTGVTYEPKPVTESQVKEMTGYGLKSEVTKGGGGNGGVRLKKGATASKGSRGTSGAGKSFGGSRPSSGGGRSGGGGGGKKSPKKNGGGKAKTIEQKDKKKHEKDYYEEVNSQLDKTEKILSGIEKEEDRLIGDKARANQNKQLKLLQKEIDLQNKKLKILTEQEKKDVTAALQKSDKKAEKILQKYAKITLPNPKFDEDGMIANYEQMSAAIDAAHNRLIKEYNKAAAKGNEERTKEIQKEIDKFDKLGESILKNAKRSNEIQTEIEEINNTIEELNDSIEDIRIDAYKASQEAIDNLKDIKESAAELNKLFRDFDDSSFINKFSIDDTPYGDLIEDLNKLDNMYSVTKEDANKFYQDLIDQKKDALKNTKDEDEKKAIQKSIDFFTEQQANLENGASLENGLLGLSQQDLARLQGWIDNPKAADNIYGDNEAALFEAYQEAYNRTLDLFKDYRELIQNTRDDILDIYSDAEEAIERQIDQFDRLSEKMEHISDTYTLYYGEDSYDQLDQFYAQQGNIMQNQLNQLTAAYNYWQEQYQKALEVGDEKLINEMQDLMDDAEDAMLDAAQELAELWVEKFENAVEASSQHIYKNLFGSNDIDELTDNWELQKDYMDRYKDDVEKAYEIDKLRSKYLDLLDEAQGSSVQTQNRIRQQMQEQLDLLENQATVSEYDVKLANAKLEILQKQMALEDAQRNKNKMQLRRDTQGNYRYVYTADQGDVKEAQQDLADSEYDAYEMTKEETVANNDRAINLLQDYIEKRAAIWNKYKDDATARGQALAELEAEYEKIFDALAEDFTNTSEGMYDILNWLIKNGTEDTTTAAINMLDALYDKNGEIKDKTGQDWMDMANLITDQVLPNIEDAVNKANLEMEDQAIELKESMVGPNGALTKIGSGADDVADSMDKAADATRTLATATDDLFTALGADDGKLQEALDKLSEYEEQLRQTQQTTSNLSNQLKAANKTIAAKNAEALDYKTLFDYQSGTKKFKKGDTVTLKKGTWLSYHRDGDQYDESGNNGFTLSKDTQVKIINPEEHHTGGKYGNKNELAKYSIGLYEAGKEVTKETGTGMNNKSDSKKTERWHISPSALRQALTYDTGGYTGEWDSDESNLSKNGKLAILHQKELVLNATDTENILAAITLMRDITQSTMGGLTNIGKIFSTNFSSAFNSTTEQRVEISATFPNATDADDIRNALIGLSDKAYQYAHRTI